MGALERLASFTILTICESKVSEPTFHNKGLIPFMVPITGSSLFYQQE
jgi:hypothetical protein